MILSGKEPLPLRWLKPELEFTNVSIQATSAEATASFRSSGKKILFSGFFRAYVEGSDDPEAALENQEQFLPSLKEGDRTELQDLALVSMKLNPLHATPRLPW